MVAPAQSKPFANPGPASTTCMQTVLGVLGNPALGRVNFEYKKLLVTGARYAVVRDKIAQGLITCHVGVGQGGIQAGSRAIAKYIPNAGNMENLPPNEFRFPSESYGTGDDEEKCVIVHEATHAIFDVFMVGKTALASDNESAAFLAAALFARLANYSMRHASFVINGPGDNAFKLADRIIAAGGSATYTVSDDEMKDLKEAVSVDYGFMKTKDGDGTNITDQFDGV